MSANKFSMRGVPKVPCTSAWDEVRRPINKIAAIAAGYLDEYGHRSWSDNELSDLAKRVRSLQRVVPGLGYELASKIFKHDLDKYELIEVRRLIVARLAKPSNGEEKKILQVAIKCCPNLFPPKKHAINEPLVGWKTTKICPYCSKKRLCKDFCYCPMCGKELPQR